jgi:hypothetical protein
MLFNGSTKKIRRGALILKKVRRRVNQSLLTGQLYNQNCVEYGYCAVFPVSGGFMRQRCSAKRRKVRGKQTNTQFADGLGDVARETTRLWRKHHLGYDRTKYVVEQVRRRPAEFAPALNGGFPLDA